MLVAIVAVLMAVGLVGTIVPLVPGLGLIAAAALAYGFLEGFGTTGAIAMALIAMLGIAGTVAGFVLPHRAAGDAGATRTSMLLGIVGAVAGFFVVPILGLPLGGTLGIYAGERLRTGAHQQAWRATVATLKGFGVGALVQLVAGVAMVVAWVVWVVVA